MSAHPHRFLILGIPGLSTGYPWRLLKQLRQTQEREKKTKNTQSENHSGGLVVLSVFTGWPFLAT